MRWRSVGGIHSADGLNFLLFLFYFSTFFLFTSPMRWDTGLLLLVLLLFPRMRSNKWMDEWTDYLDV
jgi:hypothetical protein